MKKAKLVTLIVCISILSITISARFAWSAGDVCDEVDPIIVRQTHDDRVRDILDGYNDTDIQVQYGFNPLTDTDGESVYCLVFEAYEGNSLPVGTQLTLTKLDDKDVYIIGLKIDSMMDEAPLSITHNGDDAKIFIHDLEITNANEGLALESAAGTIPPAGAIQIIGSKITGANKEGNCITVASPGTLLSEVEVTNCAEGVRINANNVQIADSTIFTNKIGVHIMGGVTGTDFGSSLIYANNDDDDETMMRFDGVRMEGIISDLRFFELVNEEPVFFEADEETVTFNNEERMARILLPENHGYDGRVELYLAKEDVCGIVGEARGQPCKIIEDLSTDISYEVLAEGDGVQTELPANYMDKEIVAIYTSTESGSTAISQKFKVASGEAGDLGVVAFVQTPYDIPTPGGGATDGAELGSGDDTDVIGGSGMDAGGSSSGMKCSLIESSMPNSTTLALEFWWIIFAIALLGSTRQAKARIRR